MTLREQYKRIKKRVAKKYTVENYAFIDGGYTESPFEKYIEKTQRKLDKKRKK